MKITEAIRSFWHPFRSRLSAFFPPWHLLAAGLLAVALIILVKTPAPETPETEAETLAEETAAPFPPLSEDFLNPLVPQSDPIAFNDLELSTEPDEKEPTQKVEILNKGDKLADVFTRAGFTKNDLDAILQNKDAAKALKTLRAGQKMAFTTDKDGALDKLVYTPDLLQILTLNKENGKFTLSSQTRKPDIVTKISTGTIKSSLYEASQAAKISDQMVLELSKIFAYDIDFAQDLQKGDTFKVIYEEAFVDGKKIGTGKILAAEFTNDGTTYRAVRYVDKSGNAAFYSPDGKALRKGFLRTPVEYARISSGFSLGRLHPILNKIRAHKGTDYSAPTGTPIRASGDGRVTLAGAYSGYGNTVIIQHDSTYTTLYGHMSRFAGDVRKGSSVKQGQIIGYVGSTGLATGPHLHYEFHVNGKVVNPVTAAIPRAQPLSKGEMARFSAQAQPYLAQLSNTKIGPVAAITNAQNTAL